ncbi:3579_t:CDS:2 [Funneliformis geosporum]|uniref:3579_t:CDS:1 n=1 Tax=Funneliformis geosporum TaxID=1117311 RepID=A0A9W4SCZ8_9GLOM|nr:3579_t:CDS:2 [Funneliformis geosporum]
MRITTTYSGILLFLFILIIFVVDNGNSQKEPKEVDTEKGKVPPNPKSPIAKLCSADPKVLTEKKLGKVEDVPFKVNIGLKEVYEAQGKDVKITIECKTPIENLIIYADTVSKDHVGQWKEQNGLALDPSCPGDKYGTLISTKSPPKMIELLWTPPWITGYNDITFKAAVFTKTGFSNFTSNVFKESGTKTIDSGKKYQLNDNSNNNGEGKGKGGGFGASPEGDDDEKKSKDVKGEESAKVGNGSEIGKNSTQQTSIARSIISDKKNNFIKFEAEPLLSSKPWYKTASTYWLLPVFALYSITSGLGISSRVQFYLKTVCNDYYSGLLPPNSLSLDSSEDDPCNNAEIQAMASRFMMILNLFTASPAFFTLGPIGSLSDRKGRRISLIIGIAGSLISTLNILLVGNFLESLGLYFLVIGGFLEGLSGGFYTLAAASHAYTTDCTPPTQRSVVFGWLQGAMYIGIALGPMIGGWIVGITKNILSVFYVMFVIYFMIFLFFIFILPESLTAERSLANSTNYQEGLRSKGNGNEKRSWINRFVSFVHGIFEPLSIFLTSETNQRQANDHVDKIPIIASKRSLLSLIIINILLSIAMNGMQSIFLLYTTLVFKWSLLEQGYVLFMMGATRVFVLFVLFPTLSSKFKRSFRLKNNDDHVDNIVDNERILIIEDFHNKGEEIQMRKELVFEVWIIRLALLIDAFVYIAFGLTKSSFVFYGVTATASLAAVANPILRSLQTNLVAPSKIGQLLGAIGVLDSIIRVIAPIIFNTLYSILVKTSPNHIWYVVSASFIIACLFTFGVGPKR